MHFAAQLDIVRFITGGLTRNRRVLSRRRISAVASVMALCRCPGGKGRLVGVLAADDSQRGDEAGSTRIELLFLGGFLDEGPDLEGDEQVGVDLLDHRLRRLRAQHPACAALVGLRLVKRVLVLPLLAVERRELTSRGLLRVEQGGDEPSASASVTASTAFDFVHQHSWEPVAAPGARGSSPRS